MDATKSNMVIQVSLSSFPVIQESSPAYLDELTEENHKLRALVTVGQDNSKQQEELIAHLQEELAKAQVRRLLFEFII